MARGDIMRVVICDTKQQTGRRAAADGAELIRRALGQRGGANIILGTGASQLEMLGELVAAEGIDWGRLSVFHLDEYIAMPASHPSSFRRFLRERFVERLPQPWPTLHCINGEADPAEECRRVGAIIASHPIDVAFIGIGENGHLAFNDPPADFQTEKPFLVVELEDEICRRQQVGEGWFASSADMPKRAISMSIRQIMRSAGIICTVPERRKAAAVRAALQGPVTPQVPASILQQHPAAAVYLDRESASLLDAR
jgi:glucosamine-6-phosphate deaminase